MEACCASLYTCVSHKMHCPICPKQLAHVEDAATMCFLYSNVFCVDQHLVRTLAVFLGQCSFSLS